MRTQQRRGLGRPPPDTISSPLYQRILQYKALSSCRQQGNDVRSFAVEFSGVAEGLGYNDEALKDLFNSALDEPLSWWRMSGLDHLTFGEFVEALARSPAKVAGLPQVVGDKAAAPPVAAEGAAVPLMAAVKAAAHPGMPRLVRKLEDSPMRSVRAADFSPTKPSPVVLEAMVERARSRARSDPGAHGVCSRARSDPGAHGVCSRARSDPGAHVFRSRARSDPRAHGVRSRARSDPGAQGVRSTARSDPGAHAFRSGPGAHAFRSDPRAHGVRSGPGAHAFRSDPGAHAFRSDPGAHAFRSGPGAHAFRSDPGAHAFRSGPGAHAFRSRARSDPGAHGVCSSPGPHSVPGAHGVRSRACSAPGAHAVRSRARSSQGAHRLHSRARSGLGAHAVHSGPGPRSGLGTHRARSRASPTLAPLCAHCSRPSSTPRAWPTSLLDIFLFSVCGASGIRSLKGGLCHGPAGVPRLATRCLCVLSTWLVVCLVPCAPMSIVCPLPSCYLIIVSVAPAVSPSLPSFVSLYSLLVSAVLC